MKHKYDLFISLGFGCPTSRNLRNCNLQFTSLPFDWLCGGNIVGRARIIDNDFKDFLQYDYLRLYSQETGKNCYENIENKICFPHDFPLNTPLIESLSDVQNKYQRRIKRFFNLIERSNTVLFVYITTRVDDDNLKDNDLILAYNMLSKKFQKQKIDILCFQKGYSKKSILRQEINNHITKYIFDFSSDDINTPWEVNDRELFKVLKQYAISNRNLSFRNILQRYKIFSKTRYGNKERFIILGIKFTLTKRDK